MVRVEVMVLTSKQTRWNHLKFWEICFVLICASGVNAQTVRTAAQLCSGAAGVPPPMTTSQGGGGTPGSLLPSSTYSIVVCAIDKAGKYSPQSTPITVSTPAIFSTLGYFVSTPALYWSPNTAGYELFIGRKWVSGLELDANTLLVSYLGPKLLGPGMPTLPSRIEITANTTDILPFATKGRSYSQSIFRSDDSVIYQTSPFTWSLAGGSPPPGISMDSRGLISGTPTIGGTFVFSGRVTNTNGQSAVQQFSITVTEALELSTASVSFQVQNHQSVGPAIVTITVSGNAQNQPFSTSQTQPWIIASVQTPTPTAAVVCCPTTIIAAVDPYQFNSPGSYTGSLIINVPGFNAATINYAVQVLAQPPAPTPTYDQTIKLTTIVNAASFGKDFAAQSLVTLFGNNMASGTFSAQSLELPSTLGDTKVLTCATADVQMINCQAAKLVYASPTQINFVAPTNRPANGNMLLTIQRTGRLPAAPLTAPILLAAPGTFLEGYDCSYNPLWNDPSPCGLSSIHYSRQQPLRGAVTDQTGNLITSQNPAVYGQQYTIWLTALGVFANNKPPQPINIKIGGTPTNSLYDVVPSYVGPSPQFPGLYQINFP